MNEQFLAFWLVESYMVDTSTDHGNDVMVTWLWWWHYTICFSLFLRAMFQETLTEMNVKTGYCKKKKLNNNFPWFLGYTLMDHRNDAEMFKTLYNKILPDSWGKQGKEKSF